MSFVANWRTFFYMRATILYLTNKSRYLASNDVQKVSKMCNLGDKVRQLATMLQWAVKNLTVLYNNRITALTSDVWLADRRFTGPLNKS
jgi:glutamine synthetase type III